MIKSNDTQASLHQNFLEGLVKHRFLGFQTRVSDSLSKGRDGRLNIPNKSPKWCCFWGLDHTLRTTAPEYHVLSLLE